MNASPVAFVTPTMRSLRPRHDPPAQVAACTEVRDGLLADPKVDRVTTQLPKRGGPAIVAAWQWCGPGRKDYEPLGSCIVLPDGSRQARP